MEDDREVRIDEDVEAHSSRNAPKNAPKNRNDEGEDVEAHMGRNAPKNAPKNRNDDGEDDVEGHMTFNHVKNNTKN
jgi:hypothetical protein